MVTRIAQYRIAPTARLEVEAAIRAFVAAVGQREPDTDYRAYALPDGVSFIHFMSFPTAAAEAAHRAAPYTLAFVEALYPRCEEPPRFTSIVDIMGAAD